MWTGQGGTLKREKWGNIFICPWHFEFQFSMGHRLKIILENLINRSFKEKIQIPKNEET